MKIFLSNNRSANSSCCPDCPVKCPAENLEVYIVIAMCTFGILVNSVGAFFMAIAKQKTKMTLFVTAITLSDIVFMASTIGLNIAYLRGNQGFKDNGK